MCGDDVVSKFVAIIAADSADHTVPTPPRKNGKVAKDAEAGGGGGAADDAPKE